MAPKHAPARHRDFRVQTHEEFQPSVYLLGYSEHSHGISNTLLSLNAHRAGIIAQSIARAIDVDAPSLIAS